MSWSDHIYHSSTPEGKKLSKMYDSRFKGVSEKQFASQIRNVAKSELKDSSKAWKYWKTREGQKETVGEFAKGIGGNTVLGGIAGGLMGTAASLPLQAARLAAPKFFIGRSFLKPTAAVGAAFMGVVAGGERAKGGRITYGNPGPQENFGHSPHYRKFLKETKNPKSDMYKLFIKNEYEDNKKPDKGSKKPRIKEASFITKVFKYFGKGRKAQKTKKVYDQNTPAVVTTESTPPATVQLLPNERFQGYLLKDRQPAIKTASFRDQKEAIKMAAFFDELNILTKEAGLAGTAAKGTINVLKKGWKWLTKTKPKVKPKKPKVKPKVKPKKPKPKVDKPIISAETVDKVKKITGDVIDKSKDVGKNILKNHKDDLAVLALGTAGYKYMTSGDGEEKVTDKNKSDYKVDGVDSDKLNEKDKTFKEKIVDTADSLKNKIVEVGDSTIKKVTGNDVSEDITNSEVKKKKKKKQSDGSQASFEHSDTTSTKKPGSGANLLDSIYDTYGE